MHISPLLHSQHRKLIFTHSDPKYELYPYIAVAALIVIVIVCICSPRLCRQTDTKAIYIENVPENCRVFTLNGTEIIPPREIHIDIR